MARVLATLVTLVMALAVAAGGGAGAAAAAPGTDCLRSYAGIDLQSATIPALQSAMAAGRISAAGLVDAYRARIFAYDRQLLAVRDLNPRAHDQAAALDAERRAGHVRGPLHGIPVLLKDNVAAVDEPLTAGSISLAGALPARDATITRRLRDAGAVILGKTNLSEFAGWVDLNAPAGWSSLAGQVVNAYATYLTPSGSSSGSGVAASMAFAAVTIGTETSGSILSPSDASGDVGVKPTMGLASRTGILPLAPSYDVPGPIVRNVTDAALVLGALAGADPTDAATTVPARPPGTDFTAGLKRGALRGVTLAYSQSTHDSLGAESQALFDAGLGRLRRLGATVTPVRSFDTESTGLSEIAAIPNEFKASLNAFLPDWLPGAKVRSLSDVVAVAGANKDTYRYGYSLLQASDTQPGTSAGYPASESGVRSAARASIDGALAEAGASAIVTPGPAHANIGAAAGYPTVETPLGYTGQGIAPMDIGFLGRAFEETRLLGYAYDFEQDARVRIAPTDVNDKLRPASCPPPRAEGPSHDEPLPLAARLRIAVRAHGRALAVTVRGLRGHKTFLEVFKGRRMVLRRLRAVHPGGFARATLRVRARGTYRVVVIDLGPPLRTAVSAVVRVRR